MQTGLRSYVFVADTSQNNLDQLLGAIDRLPEVVNWYKFMPSAAVLVSDLEVDGLKSHLQKALPGQRFLVVLTEQGKRNGWLPKKAWDLMNSPEPVS